MCGILYQNGDYAIIAEIHDCHPEGTIVVFQDHEGVKQRPFNPETDQIDPDTFIHDPTIRFEQYSHFLPDCHHNAKE